MLMTVGNLSLHSVGILYQQSACKRFGYEKALQRQLRAMIFIPDAVALVFDPSKVSAPHAYRPGSRVHLRNMCVCEIRYVTGQRALSLGAGYGLNEGDRRPLCLSLKSRDRLDILISHAFDRKSGQIFPNYVHR
jgi:hypothetical protein